MSMIIIPVCPVQSSTVHSAVCAVLLHKNSSHCWKHPLTRWEVPLSLLNTKLSHALILNKSHLTLHTFEGSTPKIQKGL